MDAPGRLRVVVVDEHLTFVEALARRLELEDDLEVVGSFISVDHMCAEVDPTAVDLVMLGLFDDSNRANRGQIDSVRRLTARDPAPHVVVMAARTEPMLVAEAIEAGISGWVPKDLGIQSLLTTARGVCRDETWIPADVLTGVLRVLLEAGHHAGERDSLLSRLTTRERDVLQCIVDGLSRNEIADRLYLSPNTVRTHVQHVLRKFGVHSSLTAAAVARNLGMERRDGPSPNEFEPYVPEQALFRNGSRSAAPTGVADGVRSGPWS